MTKNRWKETQCDSQVEDINEKRGVRLDFNS